MAEDVRKLQTRFSFHEVKGELVAILLHDRVDLRDEIVGGRAERRDEEEHRALLGPDDERLVPAFRPLRRSSTVRHLPAQSR